MMEHYMAVINLQSALFKDAQDIMKAPEGDTKCIKDICCRMQQEMIDLGTKLEKECNLANSKILKWLEVCCELVYKYSEGHINRKEFIDFLNRMLSSMVSEYFESVSEGAYTLSIAAIIKNERYIVEWIEYHLMVGVEHFYIYDNESTDGLKEKLENYINDGIVTYIYFPGKYQQLYAYNHALQHFSYSTKRMAIIDGDEYLIPVEEGKLLPQVIEEIEHNFFNHRCHDTYPFSSAYSAPGGIGVNWRMYGTSGHKTACEGLITKNYQYRAEDYYGSNAHIKTIFNPRTAIEMTNPHFVHYINGFVCISERGSYINSAFFFDGACSKIRINHYYSKSEEELIAKIKRGWPDSERQIDISDKMYEACVDANKVYDPIMERFVSELEERVRKSAGCVQL